MAELAPYYRSILPEFAGEYTFGGDGSLGPLGRVNFFVGPNNSGKSRLLRQLLQAKDFKFKPAPGVPDVTKATFETFRTEFVLAMQNAGIRSYGPVTNNMFARVNFADWYRESQSPVAQALEGLKNIIDTSAFGQYSGDGRHVSEDQIRRVNAELQHKARPVHQLLSKCTLPGGESRFYVPTLRGLRPINSDGSDPYAARTAKDYSLNPHNVFTGYSMYATTKDLLLGSREERDRIRAFEDFLSSELFGEGVQLIPHRSADVLHVRIGDREERALFELGDGLQSLLIIAFLAFTREQSSLLFLEEPETHLHPGLQRRLVELFLTHPLLRRHQIFATTHSNHLLDLCSDYGDCATILVRKSRDSAPRMSVTSVANDDRMLLHELGVRASSVFLTNASIWVEGITDRLYVREFLRKYLEQQPSSRMPLREDVHFSLIEIGGSNAAHFSFDPDADDFEARINVAKVCSNSFLVLDGDNVGKPRATRLTKELGDNVFVLTSKEIENLLPVEVVRKYVESRKLDVDLEVLTAEVYQRKNVPLGTVLDSVLGTDVFADRQTIKNKMGFCTFCVEYMRAAKDWELTAEARDLCDRLWRFVRSSNGL